MTLKEVLDSTAGPIRVGSANDVKASARIEKDWVLQLIGSPISMMPVRMRIISYSWRV